jgi:transcriptional regulator with XRE-family HTH domain
MNKDQSSLPVVSPELERIAEIVLERLVRDFPRSVGKFGTYNTKAIRSSIRSALALALQVEKEKEGDSANAQNVRPTEETREDSGDRWSEFFKKQRENLGLTQCQMAELLGCGEKSYCRWENGARPTQIVIRLVQAAIALNKILTHSFSGCEVGCLHCGEVNEIADHETRLIWNRRVPSLQPTSSTQPTEGRDL